MPQLDEVYKRLCESKAERRELNRMFRDELANHARYQELLEELLKLKEEKKSIENDIHANSTGDRDRVDGLKLEITSDVELLSDIALNMYVRSETVEITDEDNVKWVPVFRVSFKKD